jgi:hypothetical protein
MKEIEVCIMSYTIKNLIKVKADLEWPKAILLVLLITIKAIKSLGQSKGKKELYKKQGKLRDHW